jgi:L-ascorbate metabolism protein UlaG (beta-lactamase superfamily)
MTTPTQITYIGHATTLIEMDGYRLLTDPVLRNRLAHLRRQGPAIAPSWLAPLDAVLLSHPHLDHLDLPSLRLLARTIPLIVPAGAASLLRRQGFTTIVELLPGETTQLGQLSITATQAVHSGFRPPFGPTVAALGFLIGTERRIYFAGDTDLFPAMVDLSHNLDTALLPIWGWGPTLGPGHLTPERAAEALTLLRPRLAIPIHWGTLYPARPRLSAPTFLEDPPHHFARHAAQLAPEVTIAIVPSGGSIILDSESG